MARRNVSPATASAEVIGAASEGEAAQMEAHEHVGAYGPDAWPVNWNGIVLGALAALAALIVVGLTGIALKAHDIGNARAVGDLHKLGFWSLLFSVFGTFLSFALAGWVSGQIAGFRRAESCMLHGACAWLLALPIMLVLGGMGAAGAYGGWLSGLDAHHPGWNYAASRGVEFRATVPADPTAPTVSATTNSRIVTDEEAARTARNTALGVVASLLLGLMGAVVGGWISSGEPMTFSHYRTAPNRTPAMG